MTSIRSLTSLSTKDLQIRFQETFGTSTPSRNRPWLIKRLSNAPKAPATSCTQALAAAPNPGAPKERAAPTDAQDATSAPACPSTPALAVGSEIRRTWRGHELVVTVQADGFLLNGTVYRSLSAAATTLCGGNRNGLVFFGLKPRPAKVTAMTAEAKAS